MRTRPWLFPLITVAVATLFTWRPWVAHGVDDVLLWATGTSITHDGDLDITDDLLHATNPADLTHQLLCATWETGATRNPYPIGCAVIWSPVEIVASRTLTAGLSPTPRFHPRVRAALSLFALALAVISVRLFQAAAQRAGSPAWPAAMAAGIVFIGTSVVMFTTRWPTMTHQLSALTVAAHLWCLLRWRGDHAPRWAGVAGLTAGLMILVRWQNVLYLVVDLMLLLQAWRRAQASGRLIPSLVAHCAPLTLVGLLQPLAWRLATGHWFLIPQGEEYLDNTSAYAAILLCGYHGLLTVHPLFIPALLGLVLLLRRDRWLAASLLIAFVLLVHVNQMVWDWWGAAAFGQRRFSSFAAPAAIGLAETLTLIRRPWLRGVLVGGLMLWALFIIRLYDIPGGDDLTLLFTGHPANTPRIGTPPVDPTELRADALDIFSDPLDGLLLPQLFKSLDKHSWPVPALTGLLILAGIIALGWILERALRTGGWLRKRRLVTIAVTIGVAWVVAIELRIALDDQSWRPHGPQWREATQALVAGDQETALAALRSIPSEAPQHPAAQFMIAHTLHMQGQGQEAVSDLLTLLGDDTPHRYPPIGGLPVSSVTGLLEQIDPDAWLEWRRRVRDDGMQ